MSSPLAGSLAKTIGGAFKTLFLDAVLTRDGESTGPSYDPTLGEPLTFNCKAIVEKYSDRFRTDSLIRQSDRKVLILANSLGVRPAEGDRITISGITFTAMDVATDPAEAVWEVQGRM